MEFSTIPYDRSIDRKAFDCGLHPALNAYIAQQATQDEKRNVSRTFMLVEDGQLLGYNTLANASVVEMTESGRLVLDSTTSTRGALNDDAI